MSSWRWNRPCVAQVWAICLLFFSLGIIHSISAQSTSVELDVAQTKVVVKGRASPGAQVVAFIDGSEAGTTTANGHGAYNIHVNNLATGTYTLAAEAIDVTGQLSPRSSREIAVNAQQTSIVNFFLAPTVVATPSSQTFGDNQIDFRGYTANNARVRVRIGNGLLVLNTRANNQGFYRVSLATNTLAVGIFSYRAEANIGANVSEPDTQGKQFAITPPTTQQTPGDTPSNGEPDTTNTSSSTEDQEDEQVPATPTVITPANGSRIESSRVMLNGTASPGSEVLIYEGDMVIGSVLVDENGEWQFYFQATQEIHRLRAQECIDESCSGFTEYIEIGFGLIQGECALDLQLSSYRLMTAPGSVVDISSTDPLVGPDISAIVNWGTGSEQRFDVASGDRLFSDYVYSENGMFNGYVIVTDGNNCTDTASFTVSVSELKLELDVVLSGIALLSAWMIVFVSIALYSRLV